MRRAMQLALMFAAALLGQPGAAPLQSLLDQHRTQPADWKLCNQIAIRYTEAQEFNKAEEFFRKVLALNPNFVPARKNFGVVLWFLGRKTESETQFKNLLQTIPNDPVPHLYVGLACHERNEHTEAKKHFAKAGDLALGNPEVLPAVIESYLAAKDSSVVAPALKFLEQSRDPELAVRVAAVLNSHVMYEATISALERTEPLRAEGYLLLAEAYDRQDEPQRAYATYAKAIAANPDDERGYIALAAFASAHKNNRFGLEVLEKGLVRHPRSALLLIHRGLLTAIEGDRDAAEKNLSAAAEANPKWSIPVFAIGVLQLESGRIDDAANTFRKAMRDFPKEYRAYYFYALALSRSKDGGRQETIAVLQKALALEPNDGKARTLLGQSYVASEQLKEGISELERALSADARNATALYQLSLAYRKLGNTALAQQRMAAFRALKEEPQTELLQFLKIVK